MDNLTDEVLGVDELNETFGIEDDEHLGTETLCRPRGPTIM